MKHVPQERKTGSFRVRRRSFFTLIELVVVIAVIGISLGFVIATFRGESAARLMEQAGIGFETFCARARFQAQEHGEDIIVCFSPLTREFTTKRALTAEELEEEEQSRREVREGEEPLPDPPAELKWKLPDRTEISEEDFAADEEGDDQRYEIFRFFPDGGASGIRKFKLQCRKLSRTYDISPLTGLVITVKEEDLP